MVVKFWLHIDQDEQLRRFNDRQNTPSKQWKITDEDWRNRENGINTKKAIDDMLHYTSTDLPRGTSLSPRTKNMAASRL